MASFPSSREELLSDLDGFRVEIDDERERADIVLSRPPLNVVSMPQRAQLAAIYDELDKRDATRVIVLRGEGDHFSSGGDIAAFLTSTPETVSEMAKNVAAAERCRKPVIAAIHGFCFGVGFELSLACDFRIVTTDSHVALPEIRLGMIPGSGGSARLTKMIGQARTKDMAMRARRVPGSQAAEWGIAVDCVEPNQLDDAVQSLVDELRAFSPLAQRTLKQVINLADDAPLHVAIAAEGDAYGRLRSSDDFRSGVESFAAKTKPTFTGS